ncbi:MAG TPA: hypothetical protein VHL30_00235 [Chlamydiales bacterium]|jgi:hypothetical protein|nr:hypothetical protein [Chlamydiales bacterium]
MSLLISNIKTHLCTTVQLPRRINRIDPDTFHLDFFNRFSRNRNPEKLASNIIQVLKNNRKELSEFFQNADEKCSYIFLANFNEILKQSNHELTHEERYLLSSLLKIKTGIADPLLEIEALRSSHLMRWNAHAGSISSFLAEEKQLSDERPITCRDLREACKLFNALERTGPLFSDSFWDRQEAPHNDRFPTTPFTIDLPHPGRGFYIFGDIKNGEELKLQISQVADENFALKNPHHKIVFVGNYQVDDPKEAIKILYIMLRLKIANPCSVFILRDKDNPYFHEDKEEHFMDAIRNEFDQEGIQTDEIRYFYKFLPVALTISMHDGRKILLSNDEIKPLMNPLAFKVDFNTLAYSRVESDYLSVTMNESEMNQTLKFDYSEGIQLIDFRDKDAIELLTRPYLNPVEIKGLADRYGLEFDYTRSEKHIYINSKLFSARAERDTIQYFNSFLSEMNDLSLKEPDKHPEIAEIMQKPETAPGDLLVLCRAAPANRIKVAYSYKIHLMPKPELYFETLNTLFSEISSLRPEARASLAGIKILSWDKHLKIQKEKNQKNEPTPPCIVIYLVAEQPEQAQKTLDAIYALFERHPDVAEGSGITPRFNAKCSSLIYVAQGTGPDKEISSTLPQEIADLRQQEASTSDPFVKQMLKTQIKTKELALQTPTLFDENLVFFIPDLTGASFQYQLHHPETGVPLEGNSIENGAEQFLATLGHDK